MKLIKYIIISAALVSGLLLCGCTTTTVTETTYADDGTTVKSVKTSESSGNPFVILAQNSANKSWMFKEAGWVAKIGWDAETASPVLKAGTIDRMFASFCDTPNGIEIAKAAPAIYKESKYELSMNVSSSGASLGAQDGSTAISADTPAASTTTLPETAQTTDIK